MLVHQKLERHIYTACAVFIIDGIETVAHGYETHSVQGKHLLDIIAALHFVTGKTREVFCNDAVYPAAAHKVNHFLKAGTVEVCAGAAVVHKLQNFRAGYVQLLYVIVQ